MSLSGLLERPLERSQVEWKTVVATAAVTAAVSAAAAYVGAAVSYNRELAELQERTKDTKARVERIEAGFLMFKGAQEAKMAAIESERNLVAAELNRINAFLTAKYGTGTTGGYATSASYGGCSSCGAVSGGGGVIYETAPAPPDDSSPMPPVEAPKPPEAVDPSATSPPPSEDQNA